MRLLFIIDTKDYDINGTRYVRNSSRCINIKNGKVAMIYSQKYNYYKFPGGGIEKNETMIDALVRETLEETGMKIVKESIKEFGYVHRIQKTNQYNADIFVQDNYYYLCDVYDDIVTQSLDEYESEEGFILKYVEPIEAMRTNLFESFGLDNKIMLEREAKVLQMLLIEGYFM